MGLKTCWRRISWQVLAGERLLMVALCRPPYCDTMSSIEHLGVPNYLKIQYPGFLFTLAGLGSWFGVCIRVYTRTIYLSGLSIYLSTYRSICLCIYLSKNLPIYLCTAQQTFRVTVLKYSVPKAFWTRGMQRVCSSTRRVKVHLRHAP